jgi:aldehyde dehydrogenase (NAD+)/betaine-aldehyde dehydrogenase
MATTRSFINGVSVDSPEWYENIDPSTGRSLGTVARATAQQVDSAVFAARAANRWWRRTKPEDRANILTRIAHLILRDKEHLARMESEDSGKPLSQARNDVDVSARYFSFYGHAIDTYYGQSIPLSADLHVYTRREPFGVTAHIVAWNYPMQLLARAVAPAIATGNCSVAKPADETPRTAVAFAQLAIEAGLPPGVFNVVTGIGAETGAALSTHTGVDHVGFVGSTRIGAVIARAAADRVVPVVLELGGKSAQIVFPDADLDAAERRANLLRRFASARSRVRPYRNGRSGRRTLRPRHHRSRCRRQRARSAGVRQAAGPGQIHGRRSHQG